MWIVHYLCFFFFKQKTAYEMRISDWSSDVCSSDLGLVLPLLPSYASAFNADPWQITILLAGHAAGLFLGEMTWGQASDRFGRRPIILVTILMAGASQLMLAFSPNVWMAIAARLCGGFFSGNVSTIQSYMVDITPSDRVPVRLGQIGRAHV